MTECLTGAPEELEPEDAPRFAPRAAQGGALEEIRALLAAQNALLLDILGAVNGRTALELAARTFSEK